MISVTGMSAFDASAKLMIEVELFPSKEKRIVELSGSATGIELLKALGKHLDSHILIRDNAPIPIDECLRDGDEIRILPVTSGGL
jgi:sulfur carrier protein ThiS